MKEKIIQISISDSRLYALTNMGNIFYWKEKIISKNGELVKEIYGWVKYDLPSFKD